MNTKRVYPLGLFALILVPLIVYAQVFGPTTRTRQLTVTPGATVVEDLTVNGTCTGCGSSIDADSGSFEVTWPTACTTTPSQTWNYARVGKIVSLYVLDSVSCTSDSASFISAVGDLPASLRPVAATRFTPFAVVDNGTASNACVSIGSDGTIALIRLDSGNFTCSSTQNWTASGTKAWNVATNTIPRTITYALAP